ncbi:unnamed protein product [Oreochromis niloticus]|nr:unnamed protein product [Mustela putorius furo]
MAKPNYTGTYHMVEQENMDSYLGALDVNFALRKIVCLLKPTKEITHDPATGTMKIRTLTTFKNFNMDFTIGKEFTEDLGPVDGHYSRLGRRQAGLCTARRERGTRLDALAGGRQAAFGDESSRNQSQPSLQEG